MRKRTVKKNKKTSIKKIFLFILFFLSVILILLYFLPSKFWDGKNRLVVVRSGESKIFVDIFNPEVDQLISISIPANTEVQAGYGLGEWKLGSIPELGKIEKIGPRLLKDTISKSFKFPVDAWVNADAEGLVSGRLTSKLKFLFNSTSTNLTFMDRLKLVVFTAGAKSRTEFALEDSGYLKKAKLLTGEDGFIIEKNLPLKIAKYFSLPLFEEQNLRIRITDATGGTYKVSEMSQLIDVLGSKVLSINTEDQQKDLDCKLRGKNKIAIKKLENIFGCSFQNKSIDGNFDIEIIIGEGFAKRF
jgi:hypothetical protein